MAGGGREAWKDTNTVFTNDKAGMQGCDKEKVKRIVYEMSKVSSLALVTQLISRSILCPIFPCPALKDCVKTSGCHGDACVVCKLPCIGMEASSHTCRPYCSRVQDSPHFLNEQNKQRQQEARIARFKEQASRLNQHQLANHTRFRSPPSSFLSAGTHLMTLRLNTQFSHSRSIKSQTSIALRGF